MSAFRVMVSGAAVCSVLTAASLGHAADLANANYQPATSDAAWLSGVAGTKFVAVDGSAIVLTPSEGGLSLAITAPDGGAQKSTLAFVSDKLGTIADDSDLGHVIGFFRETDTGIEAQFADGRTESLVLNTAGGISLTTRDTANRSNCVSWYPADHVFDVAEKRAALAAYADRLGIGDRIKKAAPLPCAPAMHVVKDHPPAAQDGAPLVTISHPAPPVIAKASGALIAVAVKQSDVHLIDVPAPTAVMAAPATPVPAPQLIHASVQQSATPPAAAAALAAPAAGAAASDCLSVETNGADVGFRNHCGYGVQFSYCLEKANDAAATCGAGARQGAVLANGFAAVLQDAGIKSADAEHDFRWVACSGNTNDVVAHLDRADPPAGRCVKANAS
jgi:hypothetical protein